VFSMKKLFKALALLMASIMVVGMASCKSSTGTTTTAAKVNVTLKVWGAQEDQALLQQLINGFKAANTDKNYTITLGVVGEADAKTKFLEDPQTAADVFSFPNDQIRDFVTAGALYEITRNIDAIKAANMAGSIDAATLDGKLYGYPMTADNGYFLYYDKSVVSAEQVKTLDGILAAANTANKKVFMDVSNGWYIASFFLGAGGKLGIGANGKQTCDFNNATGVKAGEAIKAFTANKAFITGDDAVITGSIGTKICAGVSGTWNADKIKAKLGVNYAATKLPTFTVGGTQMQMGSFGGYKLIGVNKGTAYPLEAMALAEWLTNEQSQATRFDQRQLGPSNLVVAASAAVKANVALGALAAQSVFATSQKDVLGTYWSPAEAFGTEMEAKNYTKTISQQLNDMVKQITA